MDDNDQALLQFRLQERAKKQDANRQAYQDVMRAGQAAGAQQQQLAGQRTLLADKAGYDYTLQDQQIGGQRQLAYDRFGYDTSLQGQSQDFQAAQNNVKYQHDDELFEKQQSGRLAEQHLAQIQQERMAQFQAGVEEQRDTARMMHETALADMAQKGREAMEEILQRHQDGTLLQEHTWRAEELQKQHEEEQQKIWDTHIATGVQKGTHTYSKADQAKLDEIDDFISAIEDSPKLSEEDRQSSLRHFRQKRIEVQRRAKPVVNKTVDRATALQQAYGKFYTDNPDLPYTLDPKTGKWEVDYKAQNAKNTRDKVQNEIAHPKQPAGKGKPDPIAQSTAIDKALDAYEGKLRATQVPDEDPTNPLTKGRKKPKFTEEQIQTLRKAHEQELMDRAKKLGYNPDAAAPGGGPGNGDTAGETQPSTPAGGQAGGQPAVPGGGDSGPGQPQQGGDQDQKPPKIDDQQYQKAKSILQDWKSGKLKPDDPKVIQAKWIFRAYRNQGNPGS